MFLLTSIREKGIPFQLTTVSTYDDRVGKILAARLCNAEVNNFVFIYKVTEEPRQVRVMAACKYPG